MKMNFILILYISFALINCNKHRYNEFSMIPGYGIGNLLINKADTNHSNDLIVFTDELGKIEYIYTENKKYHIDLDSQKIEIGSPFDKINKRDLVEDSSNSGIMPGTVYVSKQGFLVSVNGDKIYGIGVCSSK